MIYDRLRVERKKERSLTALDEDTQEQVWKKFQEVRRTLGRLIIGSCTLKVQRRPCLTRTEHALGARHRGSSSERPVNGRG